ncbi:MAG: hypothetical protein ACLUE1_02145 [Adlercreutzia equolifaciens]
MLLTRRVHRCGTCVAACCYGAPKVDAEKEVGEGDMCHDRVAAGQMPVAWRPACAP